MPDWKKTLAATALTALTCAWLVACGASQPIEEPQTAASKAQAQAQPEVIAASTPAPTAEPVPTPTASPTPAPEAVARSQTSGRRVAEGTPSRPVIVSIENSDGAKPQTGLMQADIVYEFMVESLITRFQALFNDTYPVFAGPFRSARYYFMDLAQEWDGMYLHEGYGPPDGKYFYNMKQRDNKIAIYPRKGPAQFNGYSVTYRPEKGAYDDYTVKNGYRFRSTEREAPHNLYVLVDRMQHEFYGEHQAEQRERFRFAEGVSYDAGEAFTAVSLPYQHQYNPTWIEFHYNADDNRLYRYESDEKFMVRTPAMDGTQTTEQMSVQNLIVQFVRYGYMPNDDKARRTCDLTGEGTCDYFINGRHVSGTWSRPTLADYTEYRLDDGSLVTLEPGNTWISIHPNDSEITVR